MWAKRALGPSSGGSLDLDPPLNGLRAHLDHIMKRPKPTYRTKTRRELTRRGLKTHLRKPWCPVKDSLHGGSSKVSSPLIGHRTAYGKFVMDNYINAKNTQKRYLLADFPVFIPYFSED